MQPQGAGPSFPVPFALPSVGELIRTATGNYRVTSVVPATKEYPHGYVMARRAERPQTRAHPVLIHRILETIRHHRPAADHPARTNPV